jgi:hypothetical protein
MRRRDIVFGTLASAISSQTGNAQVQVAKVGLLSEPHPVVEAFKQEITRLWTAEGRIQLEERLEAGTSEDQERHARQLVALNVDVIFAYGNRAATALRGTISTIPWSAPLSVDSVMLRF